VGGKLRYHLLLFLVCWIWGLAFIAMKVLLDELSYLSLNIARFLLTALFLAPVVAFYRKKRPSLSVGEWALAIYPVAPIALFWGWAVLGESVNAALLMGTAMILAGLLSVGREEYRDVGG